MEVSDLIQLLELGFAADEAKLFDGFTLQVIVLFVFCGIVEALRIAGEHVALEDSPFDGSIAAGGIDVGENLVGAATTGIGVLGPANSARNPSFDSARNFTWDAIAAKKAQVLDRLPLQIRIVLTGGHMSENFHGPGIAALRKHEQRLGFFAR